MGLPPKIRGRGELAFVEDIFLSLLCIASPCIILSKCYALSQAGHVLSVRATQIKRPGGARYHSAASHAVLHVWGIVIVFSLHSRSVSISKVRSS